MQIKFSKLYNQINKFTSDREVDPKKLVRIPEIEYSNMLEHKINVEKEGKDIIFRVNGVKIVKEDSYFFPKFDGEIRTPFEARKVAGAFEKLFTVVDFEG